MTEKNKSDDPKDTIEDNLDEILESEFDEFSDFEPLEDDLKIVNEEALSEFDVEDDVSADFETEETGRMSSVDQDDDMANKEPVKQKKKSSFSTLLVGIAAVGLLGAGGAYFTGMLGNTGGQNSTLSYQVEDQALSETESSDPAIYGNAQQDPAQAESIFGEAEVESPLAFETEGQNEAPGFLEGEPQDISEQLSFEEESVVEGQSAIEEPLIFEDDMTGNTPDFEESAPVVEDTEDLNDLYAGQGGADEAALPDAFAGESFDSQSSGIDQRELASLENQIGVLQDNITSIESGISSRLNSLEQKIENAGNAATLSSSGASASDVSSIKESVSAIIERLNRLEKNIDTISRDIERVSEAAAKATAVPVAPAQTSQEPRPQPPVEASASKPKPQAAAPRVSSSSWQIRAISVGEAVIVRTNGTETRTINIGDSVPGLGTIKDITYKDGGWLIEGSSGSIKQ